MDAQKVETLVPPIVGSLQLCRVYNEGLDVYISDASCKHGKEWPQSIWANPHNPKPWERRETDISTRLYCEHLLGNRRLMMRLPDLSGKRLCCWCIPPDMCHGYFILSTFTKLQESMTKAGISMADGLSVWRVYEAADARNMGLFEYLASVATTPVADAMIE